MTTGANGLSGVSGRLDRPVRVAILGFGTVGQSVVRLLAANGDPGLQLTHVYNRDVARKRSLPGAEQVAEGVVWTDSIAEVLGSDADVVVELVGGLEPAGAWVRAALAAGKAVVTANKQLIAYRGAALARLAREHGVQLIYGAAVAGGVPVIPGLLQGQSADQITRVRGIVNGTCNFILSSMEGGAEYAHVLAEAQRLGYAEADPSADVDGFDARAKLCILSRVALRVELDPDRVPAQTIAGVEAIDFCYAKELGCTIRQVSAAQLAGTGVDARVGPMLVPLTSPIAWSHGTGNMVVATGRFGGDVVFSGPGAGGDPTAVAVVSDLLAVAHGHVSVELPVERREVTGDGSAPHYLRFVVNDRPGIVSAIAGALAAEHINIGAILQRPGHHRHALPFVVTTEPCSATTMARAVSAMGKLDCMLQAPLCLPMLQPD